MRRRSTPCSRRLWWMLRRLGAARLTTWRRCALTALERFKLTVPPSGIHATSSYILIPMTLNSGTRLGPYEIEAPIGAGGMGEVYRAKDTRLDRTVAVKVLPSELSSKPDCASASSVKRAPVASLNHPHICALYDVGSSGRSRLSGDGIPGRRNAGRPAHAWCR